MQTLITILFIAAALFLIMIVLLQSGKSGMGVAFGGSSQANVGTSSGMNFLQKMTVAAAVTFMLTSMILAYMSSETSSIVDDFAPAAEVPAEEPAMQEAAPEAEAPAPIEAVPAAEPAVEENAAPAEAQEAPSDANPVEKSE